MTTRAYLAAAILNWAVVSALAGIGVDFLTSTTVKPHHHQILDIPWESLTPGVQLLIMTLMKGTGMVAVVTAVSMALVLCGPFRRQSRWSRHALLVIGGTTLVPTLVATFQVRAAAQSEAPWWPHVLMLAALGLAFWLTRDFPHATLTKESPE